MSPLRQEAMRIVEATPEEDLHALIQLLRMSKMRQAIDSLSTPSEPLPDRKEFRTILERKFGLKPDAAEIRDAANFITGSLAGMSEADKAKTIKDFRDEIYLDISRT